MKEQRKSVLNVYSNSRDHNRYSFCFVYLVHSILACEDSQNAAATSSVRNGNFQPFGTFYTFWI